LADLLISDSDRDALAGAGLLMDSLEGALTFRVVASLPEVTRLLHDLRRAYSRIMVCGVPPADSGSLRSALTVLQARGTRVWWFDSHELLWTTDVRSQLQQLDVEVRLPDAYRPETERTAGLVLAHLLDTGNEKAVKLERQLRAAVGALRRTERGGPDWIALLDAAEHDHRLLTGKAIRAAALRIWDPDAPMDGAQQRLVSLQRAREDRVDQFLEKLAATVEPDQEVISFDAEQYRELRHVRPRTYTEAARRRMTAEYAQARVGRGWFFACRDPYRVGLDLPVAFMERLPDLDAAFHGYPYRANIRVEGGANVDERLMKVLPSALEEERTGRRQLPVFQMIDEDVDF
jgi:hypothetical protein